MGKEVKIGLAVMGVLLCVFGGVLFLRLRNDKPAFAARSKAADAKRTAKKPGKKGEPKITAGKHPPAFKAPASRSTDDAFALRDRYADRRAAASEGPSDPSAEVPQSAWPSDPYSRATETEESADQPPDVANSPYGDRYGRNAFQEEDSDGDAASQQVAPGLVPGAFPTDAGQEDQDYRDGLAATDDASADPADEVAMPEDHFAEGATEPNWAQAEEAVDDEDGGLRMAPLISADSEVRPAAVDRGLDDEESPSGRFLQAEADDAADEVAAPAGRPRRLPENAEGVYLVEANDNFWLISQRVYGTGAYYKALQEYNRQRLHDTAPLNAGDEISVPSMEALREAYPRLCPEPRRPDPAGHAAPAAAARKRSGRLYTVADGDTLFDIARHELGKASRWLEIYELNRGQLGDEFTDLAPGMQLALPGDPPAPVAGLPRRETYLR